ANFFELANKMSLSTAEYMTAQKIYAGWSFFGVAIIAAFVYLDAHFDGSRRAYGLSSISYRAPLPWRHASDLLDVHLFHERSDQQLDGRPARLRGGAATMGVFARGQRGTHLCGAGDHHPLCVHLYARLRVRGGLGLMSASIVLVERVGDGRIPLAVRGRPEQC